MRERRLTVLLGVWLCALVAGGVARAEPPDAPEPPGREAWLGVWLDDAVDGGAQVLALAPHGPARSAGLRTGDVILEADRRPVGDPNELGRVLDELEPGETVRLGVLRGTRFLELAVPLGSREPPAALPRPAPLAVLPAAPRALLQYLHLADGADGLRVTSITPALRRHFGAPEGLGVLVTRVDPDGPAGRAGIRVGDVLVRVGEQEIVDEAQVRGTLVGWSGTRPLEARVVRAGRPLVVTLPTATSVTTPTVELGAVRRKLELEIERLERRLEELRRELESLREEP